MAVYAIGDIQGCYDPLQRLLEKLRFDPAADTLWLTGDLVNRGHDSLAVLRLVRSLGDRAIPVLGNHDLHTLAIASGTRPPRRKDTLDELLRADDGDELLHWLRHRRLLHHDANLGWTMIHAGLPPQWELATAARLAGELEATLRGPHYRDFFEHMYGDGPARWDDGLRHRKRLRFITNCLTRLRYCYPDGRLTLAAKGPPGTQPKGALPWYAIPDAAWRGAQIVCGHWSTLGLFAGNGVHSIDTGCAWGGRLTALRLDQDPPDVVAVGCGETR